MSEMNYHIHSKSTLIKSGIFATVLAIGVYVAIILPAEFNKDPTGIGQWLGLNVLSEPAPVINNKEIKRQTSIAFQSNEVEVLVPAGRGVDRKSVV